jgi:uncharacterized membrane protein YdfJ with MMPL/SSD domain
MSLLLNWRVWVFAALVAFLAFTHLTAYRHGKQNVRSEWLASVAAANEDARRLEQQRQRRADEASALVVVRQARIAADASASRMAVDGLRGDLDSLQRASAQSLDAATKSVSALSAVFEECARERVEVAQEAAGHASDSLMYQQAWPR